MKHEEIVLRIRAELLRVQPYYLNGRPISSSSGDTKVDAQIISESLCVWSGMLLDLSEILPALQLETPSFRGRFIVAIEPAVVSFGTSFEASMRFLDDLTTLLIESIADFPGNFKGYPSLLQGYDRLKKSTSAPKPLVDLMKLLVLSLRQLTHLEERDHAATFRCFLTVTRFLKKLPVNRCDLEEIMETEYLQDERRLEAVDSHLATPSAKWWIYSINTLAREVLADFDVKSFCPKHGPGRVATDRVTTVFEKYLDMKSDARINYMMSRHGLGTLQDYCPFPTEIKSERTAKFICVPKTWKTLRGISAEPSELQFAQQAILYQLDQFFRESPFFKTRIDLHSQLENQVMAKKGSLDQSLATIDLSKASDSVSLQLVKELFKGTKLLPWLLATRSTSVELPLHGRIRTRKFAPMGSSVCFPVECIIFVLISEVARRAHMRSTGNRQVSIPRVFGDDIVCASASVPLVLDGLEQLGFIPNKDKSYWSGFYRESCGKEYWYGRDLSPIFYRIKEWDLASRRTTYDGITSIVSLYNSLYLNGYNNARRVLLPYLKRKVVKIGDQKVSYFKHCVRSQTGENGTIVSSHPTNFQQVVRVNRRYQVSTYRVVTWKRVYVREEVKVASSDDATAVNYCEWFLQSLRREPDFELESAISADLYARLPIGYEMVPRLRGVDVNRFE